MIGGSAVVYENLCKFGDGLVLVLAPTTGHQTNQPLRGWRAHDQKASYPVYRLASLQSPSIPSKSLLHTLWLNLIYEVPLKACILWKVATIVARHRVRVLCIGDLILGGWLAFPCKYILQCKIVFYIHGEEITIHTANWLLPKFRKYYLGISDAIVAVSNFTRNALINHMDVKLSKITLIYNGVDLDKFFPQPKDGALLQRYGLSERRVLLTVGRLVERKGVDRTLAALPSVLRRHPDVYYLVVGDGPYRSELERMARQYGVSEHVIFAGAVADGEIAKHYALSDIFILPNRETADGDTEGFGLVFLEANACGIPVIAGRAGGAQDAVQDGYNGLTVDGDDITAIARAIVRLLEDRVTCAELRERGFKKACESDWHIRSRQFRSLCEVLLARQRPAHTS